MKPSLGIIALLFGAGFAQPVYADTYSITLLDQGGPTIDGTGSFTFSAGTFSNFTVNWDSLTFDFTSTANATPSETYGCDGNKTISFFTYLTNSDCQHGGSHPDNAWTGYGDSFHTYLDFSINNGLVNATVAHPDIGLSQTGDFRVLDQTNTIPEPNSVILMLAALLAVAFVARKRNARGRSPATQTIR